MGRRWVQWYEREHVYLFCWHQRNSTKSLRVAVRALAHAYPSQSRTNGCLDGTFFYRIERIIISIWENSGLRWRVWKVSRELLSFQSASMAYISSPRPRSRSLLSVSGNVVARKNIRTPPICLPNHCTGAVLTTVYMENLQWWYWQARTPTHPPTHKLTLVCKTITKTLCAKRDICRRYENASHI